MMSPARRPAAPAGEPGASSVTRTPEAAGFFMAARVAAYWDSTSEGMGVAAVWARTTRGRDSAAITIRCKGVRMALRHGCEYTPVAPGRRDFAGRGGIMTGRRRGLFRTGSGGR